MTALTEAQKVFIILRDAGKILVHGELVEQYRQRYDASQSVRIINRAIDKAIELGMIWRPAWACYQARPLMTVEEAQQTEDEDDGE